MTSTAIRSGPFTWNLSPFNLNKNICLFCVKCFFLIDRLLTGRAGFRCGFRSRSMWRRTAAFRCWSRTGRCVASARSRAGAISRRRSTAASRGSCSRLMPHLKSKIRVMEIFSGILQSNRKFQTWVGVVRCWWRRWCRGRH